MTRWRRIILAILFLLPWLVVIAVGLEFLQRVLDRRSADRGEAFGREAAAAVAAECTLPPFKSGIDERRELLALDEAGRLERMRTRQELLLVCAPDGKVLRVYPGDGNVQLDEAAAILRPGTDLGALLPATEKGDAQGAINISMSGKTHQMRDYDVPLPSGGRWICEFFCMPISSAPQECAVFMRDSIWIEMWKKFRPNVTRNDVYEFRANSRGFRDAEVVLPKPADVCRIVCVGGSTTAEGPTNEWTYPNLLEAQLRDDFKTDRIEVINGGVFALASAGERERVDDYMALEPDLIVHYNFVNDVTYNAPGWAANGAGQSATLTGVKQMLRKSRFIYANANRWLFPSDALLEAELRKTTFANMQGLLESGRAHGCAVAFATFVRPDLRGMRRAERDFFNQRINTMIWGAAMNIETYVDIVDLYNRVLRQWCAERKTPCLSVAEKFAGDAHTLSDICHVWPCAMQKKARVFAEELRPHVQAILNEAGKRKAPEPSPGAILQ